MHFLTRLFVIAIVFFITRDVSAVLPVGDSNLYDRIINPPKAKRSRNKKSNSIVPEITFGGLYAKYSGSGQRLGDTFTLTGVETQTWYGGLYVNNLIRDAGTGFFIDIDVGVFVYVQAKAASAVEAEAGQITKGETVTLSTVKKSSTFSVQASEVKFRLFGKNSQDFQFATKVRIEFNLERLEYKDSAEEQQFLLDRFAAWGYGADLSFYLLPWVGVSGDILIMRLLSAYSGSNPSFNKYYRYKGEAFLELAAFRIYGGQTTFVRSYATQQHNFSELKVNAFYGGAEIIMTY